MNNRIKKKNNILMLCCIAGYIILHFATNIMEMKPGAFVFAKGEAAMPFHNFNGVFTSMQVLFCVLLVCINYEIGTVISYCMLLCSFLNMGFVVLTKHRVTPISGMIYVIIAVVLIATLNRHFRQRDLDNITDFLTGLWNRRGLLRHLNRKIKEKGPFSLFYVDLDDFKFVNDHLGHKGGDSVLITVAERLKAIAGKEGIVSRIAGDEFIVILPYKGDVQETMDEMIARLSEKIEVFDGHDNIDVYVTASVGMAQFPLHSDNADNLIKYADLAMYHGKQEGKNKGFVFDDSLEKAILRQAEVEGIVKKSLDLDYFYLMYQPQYEVASHKLRGFETLIRLQVPGGEFISPGEFIPVAEKSNLIIKIDGYVIQRALREMRDVYAEECKDMILSVNMSVKDICMSGFADKVKKVLEEENFPPQNLEIEITEYCFAAAEDTASENINKLKEMGVKIALDDFGTGYASLSYLSKLPIDLLKIDKSFIDHVATNKKSRDFVSAVISIGKLHDCEVISEGVETEEQLEVLLKEGCDFVQGYVWGKPMKYEDAILLCRQGK